MKKNNPASLLLILCFKRSFKSSFVLGLGVIFLFLFLQSACSSSKDDSSSPPICGGLQQACCLEEPTCTEGVCTHGLCIPRQNTSLINVTVVSDVLNDAESDLIEIYNQYHSNQTLQNTSS